MRVANIASLAIAAARLISALPTLDTSSVDIQTQEDASEDFVDAGWPEDHDIIDVGNGIRVLGPPKTINEAEKVKRILVRRYDHCGGSSFASETTNGSPRVTDCRQLQSYMASVDRAWVVRNCNGCYNRIAEAGDCRFGAGKYYDRVDDALIGSQDMADLIHDSIGRFQSNGRVGARGRMQCVRWGYPNEHRVIAINWRIYRTY